MIIKVCGINSPANLKEIDRLGVDMIGLNFYKRSKRYVHQGTGMDEAIKRISAQKVGVFVDEELDVMRSLCLDYGLDYIQLHGDESVGKMKAVQQFVKVIKVFRIDRNFEMNSMKQFLDASYFLLDTKTTAYGGSGLQFDWSILDNYDWEKPFLLSGGIGPDHISTVAALDHPSLTGIDINSKYEITPGTKDPSLVLSTINALK